MGAEPLYELTGRPWPCCVACRHEVRARTAGRNLPCRCVAGVDGGACCGECDVEAADALQEALEDQDAEVMAQRHAVLDQRVEEVLRSAEAWRPGMTGWIMFAAAVSLLLGAFETLR